MTKQKIKEHNFVPIEDVLPLEIEPSEPEHINYMSLVIMLLGVMVALLSAYTKTDLMFVAGVMFGMGLSNLR